MSNRTLVMLTTFLAVACSAQSRITLAADQPITPVVTVVETVGDKIGADVTVDVTNLNAFAVDLVFVDCIGVLAERKFVYGPAMVHFKGIAANGKVTGKVDMIVDKLIEALTADPDMKQFPEPSDTKCQVREFETPVGHIPVFKYRVPNLAAPAN